MTTTYSHPIRTKQPAEIRTLTFDFGFKLASGATLTGSATVTVPAGLTHVGSPTVGTKTVTIQVSGGTLGQTYPVSVRCGATNGDILELDVLVRVADEN